MNLTVLVLGLAISFASQAQKMVKVKAEDQKETAAEIKARDEMRWMQENLALSNEQYDQVNVISYDCARKCDSIDHIADMRLREQAKEQCKKDKNTALKGVLTPEQYKIYATHKTKRKNSGKSPFSGTY
jgi:hypothetical protein